MSTEETFETPKKSHQKSTSPIASIYLSTVKENNSFGMYYIFKDDIYMIDVTRPEYYTEDDFKMYKEILIETDSIYLNNDKSTGRAKSSGGAKYVSMISNIWKEINEKKRPITKPKGESLRQYTNDRIEYRYIDNIKQLTDRLQLIAAEERAGNNNYHNEKLGILHLCKTSIEKIIDTPK
ncbi:Uncharacterized protein FWK35_00030380, partial [Aphis craccivora]